MFCLAALSGVLIGAKLLLAVFLNPTSSISPKFTDITIEEKQFSVEIADDPEEIHTGLSERRQVGSDGMLFVFKPARMTSFWMKDMLFPIDIVWISGGKIIAVDKNIPPPKPDTPDDQLSLYSPPSAVDHVLELPAGDADFGDIKIGSEVKILQ